MVDPEANEFCLLACAGVRSAQRHYTFHPGIEIIDEHVEVEPKLADLRFRDGLEVDVRASWSVWLQP
jgi:hypothetical protein